MFLDMLHLWLQYFSFGGIQLVFLGLIGEYLGRAFYETKGRPLYFIDTYNEERETNQKK